MRSRTKMVLRIHHEAFEDDPRNRFGVYRIPWNSRSKLVPICLLDTDHDISDPYVVASSQHLPPTRIHQFQTHHGRTSFPSVDRINPFTPSAPMVHDARVVVPKSIHIQGTPFLSLNQFVFCARSPASPAKIHHACVKLMRPQLHELAGKKWEHPFTDEAAHEKRFKTRCVRLSRYDDHKHPNSN